MQVSELVRTFEGVRQQCVWIQSCFETNRDLFGAGTGRHEVMRRTASGFFGDLNRILYEYYILQVCKLTDPPETRKRENLTVAHLDSLLVKYGLWTQQIGELSEGLHRYREVIVVARNRAISHSDKETALAFVEYGAHTKQEAEAFLDYMHDYISVVGDACGARPLDFRSTTGPGDVSDLFRALNGGAWVPPDNR